MPHGDERAHAADPPEGRDLAVDARAGELEGLAGGVRLAIGEEDLATGQREAILDARVGVLDDPEGEDRFVVAARLHEVTDAVVGASRLRLFDACAELGGDGDHGCDVRRAHRCEGLDLEPRSDHRLVEGAERALPGGRRVGGHHHRHRGQKRPPQCGCPHVFHCS